jgi:hypothetical protein
MKRVLDFGILFALLFLSYNNAYTQGKFDEKTAFLYMLSSNPSVINDYVPEYMYRFENEQYHIYANDEFECYRITEQLIKSVGSMSTNNTYFIESKASFGIYDFTNEAFEFVPINLSQPIEILKYMFSLKGKTNTKIDIHFNNGDEITHLPLKREQANYLVKLKKNQKSGKIERTVDVKIVFQVDPRTDVDATNPARTKCDMYLNVLSVDVYDNPGYTAGPIISIPTVYKAQKEAGNAAKAQASK